LTQIARIDVVMYLMALPMQVIFGWNITTILLLTGATVTVYSFLGGILAVIWTDAIQAVVLMAGAVICLAVMLLQLPEGPTQVFTVAAAQQKFSLGSVGLDMTSKTVWVVLAYGVAINLQNFGVDQSYVQRYIAAKSEREARRSLWLGGLLYVPVSALFFFIGTTLFALYQGDGPDPPTGDLDEVRQVVARQQLLQEGASPEGGSFAALQAERAAKLKLDKIGDRVFPHFIAKHLPPGLTGLLVAAVFAAAMSTISTSLNSSATLVLSDFYRRLIHPAAGPRAELTVLYGATILWGAMGTALALRLVRLTDSALAVWWTLSGILGGGVTGLFLLGMISRRAKNPAAVAGVLAGGVLLLWMSLPKLIDVLLTLPADSAWHDLGSQLEKSTAGFASPFDAFLAPVFAALTILYVGATIASMAGGKPLPPADPR
ncbi:MAG: sodium:solute symporter, partial [Planctomycetales bacterium]|nr:sodium:solute symporter [Planctomycetales bacterium]